MVRGEEGMVRGEEGNGEGRSRLIISTTRFDTGRVTKRVLDRLLETGHPDAAFQLAENSTRYAADFRFTLAFNAKFFEKALSIASAEYEKSKGIVPSSLLPFLFLLFIKTLIFSSAFLLSLFISVDARYRARLLAVGQASMEAKKFELSKKAFELASDTLALLHLYVVANYKVNECLREPDGEGGRGGICRGGDS